MSIKLTDTIKLTNTINLIDTIVDQGDRAVLHPRRGVPLHEESRCVHYRGTSLVRKCTPLGPYRRPMPRVLGGVLGGWAFSYWRGTPVAGDAATGLWGPCASSLLQGSPGVRIRDRVQETDLYCKVLGFGGKKMGVMSSELGTYETFKALVSSLKN